MPVGLTSRVSDSNSSLRPFPTRTRAAVATRSRGALRLSLPVFVRIAFKRERSFARRKDSSCGRRMSTEFDSHHSCDKWRELWWTSHHLPQRHGEGQAKGKRQRLLPTQAVLPFAFF